jgi:hypothetical protein
MDLAAQTSEVGEQTQRLLHGAKDLALEKVVPGSIQRARDLAERLPKRRYLDEVQALERDFAARAERLERRLEQRAKRLGIDTPRERRRRRGRRRRATGAVVLVGLGGAAAFVIWRRQQSMSPAEQPPERRDEHAAGLGAPASDGHSRDDRWPVSSSR